MNTNSRTTVAATSMEEPETRAGQHACGRQALFLAVLGEHMILALRGIDPFDRKSTNPVAVKEARNWFGSEGFQEVCTLAGLDPDWVMRVYREQRALPLEDRWVETLKMRSVTGHLGQVRGPRTVRREAA